MPVCDDAAAKKLGACLTNYYHSIGAPAPKAKPQAQAPPAARVTPTPQRSPPPRQTSSTSSYGSSVQSRSYSNNSNSSSVLRGDASSATSRREAEMREMFPNKTAGGGSSVKDRMKMFNNNNTVNFDPIHFAVNKNKEARGKYHICSFGNCEIEFGNCEIGA